MAFEYRTHFAHAARNPAESLTELRRTDFTELTSMTELAIRRLRKREPIAVTRCSTHQKKVISREKSRQRAIELQSGQHTPASDNNLC